MAKDEKPKDGAADLASKMLKSLLPDTTEKAKDNFQLVVKTAGILSRRGVSISHLREALAIMIGVMSTKLGDPVPMVITEDEGAGEPTPN